jgi:hypothetical protein
MKRLMIFLLIAVCAAPARTSLGRQAVANTAPSSQTERTPARQNREGAITGRVIGPDGQPAPNARVVALRISETSGSWLSTVVADDGNFKLTGLSPGIYILLAHAPGYVSAETPAEETFHRIGESVTIGLVKGGVITGRVTDEAGEPVVSVSVTCHRLRNLEEKTTGSRLDIFDYGTGGVTDDRGIYRVYGLQPGRYIVSVNSDDGAQIRRDSPTYHPSATRDTAAEINVRSGEEVSGVDIRHRGDRGHVVSGSVSGEIKSPTSYVHVPVTLNGGGDGRLEDRTWTSNTSGFAFYGVPDGAYELIVTRGSDDGETSGSARRRVLVKGADVSGVELKLAPRGSIAGRVVIESSTPPKRCAIRDDRAENQASGQIQERIVRRPVVEEVLLMAHRDDPNHRATMSQFGGPELHLGSPSEKGEFALKNLEAGRYNIMADLPDDGWRVRAINQSVARAVKQSGGATAGAPRSPVDVPRDGVTIKPGEKLSGVEVIVAEDATTLGGRVVPAKDEAKLPSSLRAHLVPAEVASADDVIRYAETDVHGDGSFEFKHVAPGRYLLLTRRVAEKEAGADQTHPLAWDVMERVKLRREAAAAKIEIELKPCQRVRDYILRR